MSSNLTEEAKKLPVDERIALVEDIWDSIAVPTQSMLRAIIRQTGLTVEEFIPLL